MNPSASAQPGADHDPVITGSGPLQTDGGAAWLQEHFHTEDGDAAEEQSAQLEQGSAEAPQGDENWSEPPAETPHRTVVGGFLIALAVAWAGTVAWAAGQAVGGTASGAPDLVRWAAVASGPLALIGLGWLLFGRSSRSETVRFTRTVQAMRLESEALQAVLANVGQQLAGNRAALAEDTSRLMHLGEEAAERLGAVTRDVDAGAQAMARYADMLDRSAGSARTDIGVLLADLPKADAQARAMAEMLRAAGLDAHSQAGALEAQVSVLASRAREADEATSGAAGRMTAHIAQVDSAAAEAASRMEAATAAMSAGVDGVLDKAAEAISAVRSGIDEQGVAMLAVIDQSGAAVERVGADAELAFGRRLDGTRIQLAEQGEVIRGLVAEASDAMDRAGAAARQDLTQQLETARLGVAKQSQAVSSLVAQAGGIFATVGQEAETKLGETLETARAGLETQLRNVLGLTQDALQAMERAGIDAGNSLTKRVDVARQMLGEQGAAMLAMVEKSNLKLGDAGTEAAAALTARVADIAGRIDRLAAQLAAQDAASQSIIGGLDHSMGDMETRFANLSDNGGQRMATLTAAVEALLGTVSALGADMAEGDKRIGGMTERTHALKIVLDAVGGDLEGPLSVGLADVEARAMRSRELTAALSPDVAALAQAAGAALARLAEAEALMARQHSGIDAIQSRLDALGTVVADADGRAEKLVRDTGPQLIESLLRVREAANQATERAREAISTAIPDAAAKLGDATGAAMNAAITSQVAIQMGELGTLSEQAVEAARSASERLTRQMVTIGETVAAVEARISEAQESLREGDSEQFSRRVALLIESLNSTAIDVTKILSNEVTDSAWAAYLKGDRGVFTRRAVRLLEAGEAREIARYYEEEPEFREQVNRYIHDFEALLRRVLAERDGSPLGVTLLSSDMGKLYVALAQAIERIRG